MTCFAFDPQQSGSCQTIAVSQEAKGLLPTERGNWNGDVYPPLFYAFFGIFASSNITVSILTIRFLNAVIATTLISITMWALPRRLRPVLGFSLALSIIPLGLFLLASTNPSSWGVLSVAVVFPVLLSLDEMKGARRVTLIAIAIISIAMGAGSRADTAVFIAIAAVLAWFMSKRRRWQITVFAGLIVLFCITSFLSAGQSGAVEGLGGSHGASASKLSLTLFNLTQLPALWLGIFNNLGWLDTAISPLALLGVTAPLIGVLFTALSTLNFRKALSLCAMVLAITAVPLYMLYASNASVGSQVQPRYILPLLTLLIAVAIAPSAREVVLHRSQLAVVVVLLSCAHAIALYDEFARYVAGERVFNLDAGDWWWASSPVGPTAVLMTASIAATLLLITLAFAWYRDTIKKAQSSCESKAPQEHLTRNTIQAVH